VVVGPCTGARREQFKVQGKTIRSAFGGCIDNHATKPANPQCHLRIISIAVSTLDGLRFACGFRHQHRC
jgi:hypothetical protein